MCICMNVLSYILYRTTFYCCCSHQENVQKWTIKSFSITMQYIPIQYIAVLYRARANNYHREREISRDIAAFKIAIFSNTQCIVLYLGAAAAADNYHRERYIVLVYTPGWSTQQCASGPHATKSLLSSSLPSDANAKFNIIDILSYKRIMFGKADNLVF